MEHIKIYAYDYANLNEVYSDKNVIKNIYGKEYVVANITDTELNSTTINPETLNKMFINADYRNNNARYNTNIITYFSRAEAGIFGLETDVDWARTETLFYSGEFEFTTNEVIDFNIPLSCKFKINYTKSGADALGGGISGKEPNYYKTRYKTTFFGYGGSFPMKSSTLTIDRFLPCKESSAKASLLWAKATAKAIMPNIEEYCYPTIINKTSSSTTIKVKYRFKIWGAWATDNQENNTVLCVNNITIGTYANTVETDEYEFDYISNNVLNGKTYNLETNELFQTELTDVESSRQSYITSQDIFSSYKNDRRIVSFDLYNLEKYNINDAEKFENGINEDRYLDVDDFIELFDEHNKSIGNFRILKCNPIWDGSYYKKVVAILV